MENTKDLEAARKTDEYVAGIEAENARCRQILIDKMKYYDSFPDRALEAQCFDHAQSLLGGWAYEAALRGCGMPCGSC